LWSYWDDVQDHHRRYSPESLGAALRGAGFTIEYLSPFMAPLLPLIWLGRRAAHLGGRARTHDLNADARDEFRIPRGGMNAVLYHMLRAEAPFIRHRRKLPFGSSLFAVARRAER
jgi:hypothetical protein